MTRAGSISVGMACSLNPGLSEILALCPKPQVRFFDFLFQYEYFNAVLINERDKDGNFLELGKEFILAPNDHFNNLPVNISLSDVQVPTNMYNKGKTNSPALFQGGPVGVGVAGLGYCVILKNAVIIRVCQHELGRWSVHLFCLETLACYFLRLFA